MKLSTHLTIVGLLLVGMTTGLFAQPKAGEGDPAEWATGGIMDPPPIAEADFKSLEFRYRGALKSNQLGNEAKDQLDKVFHYRVAEMAHAKNRFTVGRDIDKITNDLRAPGTSANARAYILDILAKYALRLTKESPDYARVAGVTLLRNLNVDWNPNLVPYAPSAVQLMELLKLPDSDIFIKSPSALRLGEILEQGAPPLSLRVEIATTLSTEIRRLRAKRDEVEKKDLIGYDWYLMRLTQALGKTQRPDNLTATLSFVDVLMEVLVDRKQNFMTRATAGRALSQLELPRDTNLELINHETGLLGVEMSRAYQANPNWWMWGHVYLTVYLAYDAETKEQIARNEGFKLQVNRPGLAGSADKVTAVRNLLLPLVKTVVNQAKNRPALKEADIKALETWLNDNPPADRKVRGSGPEFPPVGLTKPAEPQVNAG